MAISLGYIEIPPKVVLKNNRAIYALEVSGITTETNVKVFGLVTMYPGEATETSRQLSAFPDEDGIVELDASGAFQDNGQCPFTFPEHVSNMVLAQALICTRYTFTAFVCYTDSNGDYQTGQAQDSVYNQYYLPGGISLDDDAKLYMANTDWFTDYKDNLRWLNWLPGEKTTREKSLEKLYYLATENKSETLTIDVILTGGEDSSKQVTFTAAAYMVYELSVSYAMVKALFNGQNIDSYTVTLGDGRTQSYRVNRNAYLSETFFLAENNYRVIESVICFGKQELGKNYGKTLHELQLESRYTYLEESQKHTRDEITHQNRVNTGFIPNKEWAEWAADILLPGGSKFIYTQTSIHPVIIKTDSATYMRDPNYSPYSIALEWDYSKRSRYQSRYNIPLQFILPPYLSDVEAFYFRTSHNKILDKMGGDPILITDEGFTVDNAVFHHLDDTYWDPNILGPTYYPAGNTLAFAFWTAEAMAELATPKTHNLIFFRDFENNDYRNILPIIVYKTERTQAQMEVVVKWLDWVVTLFSNEGDYFVSNEGDLFAYKPA